MGELVERIIESESDDVTWKQHIVRYEFAKRYVVDKSVLDVACGTGYGTYYLAGSCRDIVGLDISEDAINYARSRYTLPNLEYHKGDATRLDGIKKLDTVVSFETIEHLANPDRLLNEVVKVMLPQGTFIVSTPNCTKGTLSDRPRNPYHVREWRIPEFTELLHGYFDDIRLFDQFLYIEQGWYPGSRTISRLVMRIFQPDSLDSLHKWEVTKRPDNSPARICPRYVVAVCTAPKTTQA